MSTTIDDLPPWIDPSVRILTAPGTSEADWLIERAKGIGASDVSGILGVNNYSDPFTVWAEKTGRAKPKPPNRMMEIGHVLEPAIRKWYEEDMDLTVWHGKNVILGHPQDPWLRYSPDGIVREVPRLFEAKTARRDNEWRDDVSSHAEAQIVTGMAVVGPGADSGDVVLLPAGDVDRLSTYPVPYTQPGVDYVRETVARFWHDHIVKDVAPPPSFVSLDTVLEYVGNSTAEKQLIVDGDQAQEVRELTASYVEARDWEKESKKVKDTVKANLALLMGDAEVVYDTDMNKLFSYKTGPTRRVTNDSLIAAGLDPNALKVTTYSRTIRI